MSDSKSRTGRCYCGAVSYAASGDPVFQAQCHCKPCQFFSGGGPNYFMAMPRNGFEWTGVDPAAFAHPDVEGARTRRFCPTCGTHLITELPGRDYIVIKVGTLDDPADYDGPAFAIFAEEKQSYHLFPEGIPVFDKLPPR